MTGYINTAAIFLKSYCDELEAADPTTASVEVAAAIAAPAIVGQPRSTIRGPRIVGNCFIRHCGASCSQVYCSGEEVACCVHVRRRLRWKDRPLSLVLLSSPSPILPARFRGGHKVSGCWRYPFLADWCSLN